MSTVNAILRSISHELKIIALSVQGILYGLYLATLAHCLRWLLYEDEGWKIRRKIHWPILAITIVHFLTLTTNMGAMVRVGLLGVVNNGTAIFATILYWLTLLTTDAFLMYRCWVLYTRSWRIICVPLALWFSCLICAILTSYCYSISVSRSSLGFCASPDPIVAVYYSCNIAVNIYTTSAIIYRIQRVASANMTNSRHLYKLCRILAESGILYTSSNVLYLVTAAAPAHIGVSLMLVAIPVNLSMAGISFNLISIRVGSGRVGSGHRHSFVEKETEIGTPPSPWSDSP